MTIKLQSICVWVTFLITLIHNACSLSWQYRDQEEDEDIEGSPPLNVLFIMCDQLRWDALSYARSDNSSAFKTPNLDALAAESLILRSAYSTTPSCTPARSALLTGLGAWRHGLLGYDFALAQRYPLEFPRILNGDPSSSTPGTYITAAIGKNHFGWNHFLDRGVDHGYNETDLYDGIGDLISHAEGTPLNPIQLKYSLEVSPLGCFSFCAHSVTIFHPLRISPPIADSMNVDPRLLEYNVCKFVGWGI